MSVLAVTFAACNNATTQGQLVDAWKEGRPYERYTYSVNDSAYDGVEGTYVSEIFYHAAYNAETAPEKVTVGDSTFEQHEGYLIRSTLEATLDGKAHLIVTECYFSLTDGSSYLLPSATFRSESVDGNEVLRMNGTYSGNSLSYTLKTADGEKKGSIGLGSVFYDNNEFHQSLRGVSTFSTSFSFGFSTAVVNATEQTSASLTLSVSGTENISGLEFDSVGRNEEGAEIASETTSLECYKATLSRSTTVAGASQTLYYTVAPVYAAVNEAGDRYASTDTTSDFLDGYETSLFDRLVIAAEGNMDNYKVLQIADISANDLAHSSRDNHVRITFSAPGVKVGSRVMVGRILNHAMAFLSASACNGTISFDVNPSALGIFVLMTYVE